MKMNKTALIGGFLAVHLLSSSAVLAQSSAPFVSDVPLVQETMLVDDYWYQKLNKPTKALMSQAQIAQFNQDLVANDPHVTDPLSWPASLTKAQLTKEIQGISKTPSSKRFYADGSDVTKADFARYHKNTNVDAIAADNSVQYGLVVNRTVLRTFPTDERVFNSGMDTDLDRFQETGAFPGETVAVLHESADKQWYLVAAYNYTAWVKKADIAVGDKEEIKAFSQADDFIVVTGDKVFTNYVPDDKRVSQVQLDMGVRLPLTAKENIDNLTYGQNSFASYIVQLPVRNDDGSLSFKKAMIKRSEDVNIGYLPMTKGHLVNQGFKFLGERYGWGHDYNARDCTGFVGEIYKTFGIKMPRNSSWQGAGEYGTNWRFDKESSTDEKMAVVNNMEVGDLIYIPGHVMMYLGEQGGEPFVIHDVKGLGYIKEDGSFYSGELNGVSVTPLLPLQLNAKTSYLDRIYNIKRIR